MAEEREIQSKRESMIFMVRYQKDILIPSDPLQQDEVENPRPQFFRIDLDEIFYKLQRIKEEKMGKIRAIRELEDTLRGNGTP